MRGRLLGAILMTSLLIAVSACDDVVVSPTAHVVPGATLLQGRVTAPRTILGLPTTETAKALDEAPVEGAVVTLTDAAGQPLPDVAPATTDALGQYHFPQLPPGRSYVVNVTVKTGENQAVTLMALARTGEPVVTVDVSTQTTLVAATVLEKGTLGAFSPATFRRAAEVLSADLTASTLPDLSDRAGMIKAVRGWAETNAALAEMLGLLEDEMAAPAPGASGPAAPGSSAVPVQVSRPPAATPKPPPPVWSATVTIRGSIYIPEVVSVYQGGRVVIINREAFQHSMTAEAGASFDAPGMLQPGQTEKTFFNVIGEHGYTCSEHPAMKGKVVVVAADGAPPPPADLLVENPEVPRGGGGATALPGTTPAPGSTAAPGATPTPVPTPSRTPFVNVTPTPTPTPVKTPTPTPTPQYPVTTFAGTAVPGYQDGLGSGARFNYPAGMAIDAGGSLFVADTENHAIRRVNTLGYVETWLGASAMLNNPMDVAVAPDGTLYVADTGSHRVLRVSPSRQVSALAGSAFGVYDLADGQGDAARFHRPSGVAVDANGHVFVADAGNNAIRRIAPDGTVTTVAGDRQAGAQDGPGAQARFNSPTDVVVGRDGTLYVADSGNSLIRKIAPDGEVTTIAGSSAGYGEGAGASARFNRPTGLALDASGKLYVADFYNHRVRVVTTAGSASKLAGSGDPGFREGTRDECMFYHPYGVAVAPDGTVYVADHLNMSIRRVR